MDQFTGPFGFDQEGLEKRDKNAKVESRVDMYKHGKENAQKRPSAPSQRWKMHDILFLGIA